MRPDAQSLSLRWVVVRRRLLVSMASVYRREGWEQLLCAALQSLRECARRMGACP